MKKKLLFTLLVLGAIAGLLWSFTPENRSVRFVQRNGAVFSELVNSGEPIPSTWDVDLWDGEHPMYEFTLGYGIGDRQYWGVYYSPDDVPLPFQNIDVQLSADGEGVWTWTEVGDNHGMTKKIADRWYYFEPGF